MLGLARSGFDQLQGLKPKDKSTLEVAAKAATSNTAAAYNTAVTYNTVATHNTIEDSPSVPGVESAQ
jgi:hypothetical protein